jgi:putative pyoverdin transport system ATP-binding/permease protein
VKITAFFLRHSSGLVLVSIAAGLLSGACNAALLAVINSALRATIPSRGLIACFAGLCVLLPFARFASERLLATLGQEAMYKLRMQLCEQMLAVPLKRLEQLGTARLLTALTEDVPSITVAISIIPLLCVNAALVIGCLVYLGTLSWTLLAVVMVCLVLGILSYQLPIIKVEEIFGLARKDADALQAHFRVLSEGLLGNGLLRYTTIVTREIAACVTHFPLSGS